MELTADAGYLVACVVAAGTKGIHSTLDTDIWELSQEIEKGLD